MTDTSTATPPPLVEGVSRDTLRDIEHLAVELASIAGTEIAKALGGLLAVKYKTAVKEDEWRDPVSEVDGNVERMIRKRLAENFPDHDIIGEEMDERPARGNDFVWSVDPIDGTANFFNGFPLFAASIGVLHKGVPVVGALWCPVSHALRAGVYHCTKGGKVRFDGADVTPKMPAPLLGPQVRPSPHVDSLPPRQNCTHCALPATGRQAAETRRRAPLEGEARRSDGEVARAPPGQVRGISRSS